MRKLTLATLILITLVCSAYAVEVEIPDANLERVIRDELNKPEGPITKTDLESITELDSEHDWGTPDEEKVADLTGLEYCTNLTELYLMGNQISDISPLSNLTNLTELYLFKNQIKDISALSNLTNLTELNLYNNQISDLKPLVDNPGIDSGDEVDVCNNPLSYASVRNLG